MFIVFIIIFNYCASSAPAPLIPPRLTETKAQHESSMTEQALEAKLQSELHLGFGRMLVSKALAERGS